MSDLAKKVAAWFRSGNGPCSSQAKDDTIAAFIEAAQANVDLLVCYRLRHAPSEKVLNKASTYDAALRALADAIEVK